MSRISGISFALLLISGCGDRSRNETAQGDPAPAAKVIACDVLTREEVGEVMGFPVQRTEPRELTGDESRYASSCTYIAERGQALLTTTLMLRRSPEVRDPAAGLKAYVDGLQTDAPGYTLDPVAELGPGAGWHAGTTTLWVFRPGWMVSVAVDRESTTPALDGARALTAKALERLP